MSEQIDLPLPSATFEDRTRHALTEIRDAVDRGDYPGTIRAIGLFTRIVWDIFYRRPIPSN